ncbi:hypothetical protein RhiirC2_712017 [Rhizophagus irregularis]|uniref:Uncharacterized protein n=1 Tax=Rhizophagus irregularis TaxID=588596 RepID=A0A2N1N8N4_9GLOM|nr:hypothetical protein RhiirC2_712017 [Rhizophagus irregularis]
MNANNWDEPPKSYAAVANASSQSRKVNPHPQSIISRTKVGSVNQNEKGKQKEITTPQLQRRPWNESMSNNNSSDRLTRLEKQMEKFTELLNNFNTRLNNLEMQMIKRPQQSNNQPDLRFGTLDSTFTNSNNKRAKTVQPSRNISIATPVIDPKTIISSVNDGFKELSTTEFNNSTDTPNVQNKSQSPFDYVASSDSDMLIDSQSTLDKNEHARLDKMEKNMNRAFASLEGISNKFASWVNPSNPTLSPEQSHTDTYPTNNNQQ